MGTGLREAPEQEFGTRTNLEARSSPHQKEASSLLRISCGRFRNGSQDMAWVAM